MNENLNCFVQLTEDGDDLSSGELVQDSTSMLTVEVDESHSYASLTFTTRLAMYEFGKSLMREAVFGTGDMLEFYCLPIPGGIEVINGARLSEGSARLFVFNKEV
jgi:hypothetical protein